MELSVVTSEGLSHFSYFLSSGTEAIVIDPRRDVEAYLNYAREKGVNIKYIFETHRNEDYIIGSLEIKDKYPDVKILHGSVLDYSYGVNVTDGEEYEFGECKVKAIHTPGHTLGSISYVVFGEESDVYPLMVFTGDVLFAGDTGRTDFYPDRGEEVSRLLYNSIHKKILKLGDGVLVYPAHGAGSVCGSTISERMPTSIGLEKQLNTHLQMAEKEFVEFKVNEHHYYPPYFKKMEDLNLSGAPRWNSFPPPRALDAVQFGKEIGKDCMILDIRDPTAFAGGHIINSLNIWLDGIPSFAGWFLDYRRWIYLVMDDQRELPVALEYLKRIGYDNVVGYLVGGMSAWYSAGNVIVKMDTKQAPEVHALQDSGDMFMLDIRTEDEWEAVHIPGAMHIYLGELAENLDKIPKNKQIIVYCSVGLRSSTAASYLLKEGFTDTSVLLGGLQSWQIKGYKVE